MSRRLAPDGMLPAMDPANRAAAARRVCPDPDSDGAQGGDVAGAGTRPVRAGAA